MKHTRDSIYNSTSSTVTESSDTTVDVSISMRKPLSWKDIRRFIKKNPGKIICVLYFNINKDS